MYAAGDDDGSGLVACSKCGRRFNSERIGKHESVCIADLYCFPYLSYYLSVLVVFSSSFICVRFHSSSFFTNRKRKEFNSAAHRAPEELKELQKPVRGGGRGAAGARAGTTAAAAASGAPQRGGSAAAARPGSDGGAIAVKKKKKWQVEHEQFMSAMRSAKQMRAYEQSGDPSLLPPPPAPSENEDYVQVQFYLALCVCSLRSRLIITP